MPGSGGPCGELRKFEVEVAENSDGKAASEVAHRFYLETGQESVTSRWCVTLSTTA